MEIFDPKLEILPLPQQKLWVELQEVPKSFILYGGTAVALHLGHRQSVDFDFFGWQEFAPLELASSLGFLQDAKILESSPNTLTVSVDRDGPVKVSFFAVPRLQKIKPPFIASDTALQVASLLDLAGSKLKVIQQRAEAKDYIDVDAILNDKNFDLPLALAAGQYLYGNVFSPQNAMKALTYFEEPQLSVLTTALRMRLVEAVKLVDLDRLPRIVGIVR